MSSSRVRVVAPLGSGSGGRCWLRPRRSCSWLRLVGRRRRGGALDLSFASGGKVLTDPGAKSDDVVLAVAVPVGREDRCRRHEQCQRRRRLCACPLYGQRQAGRGLRHRREGADRPRRVWRLCLCGCGPVGRKIVAAGYNEPAGGSSDFALVRYTTMALAWGLARKTIAPAISSGFRRRPSGIRRVAARTNLSFSKNAAVIGATVNPGATAFTRTPYSAQSIASERVSAATAPLPPSSFVY